MRPEHLPLLTLVGTPTVAADGSFALVSTVRPSFEADAYVGQLWRVPLDGGDPVRVTRGFHDSSPQISPDGSLVAFLRRAPGERAQLRVAPAAGGESAQVTDQPLGVSAFCWSPDSTRLVFTARVPADGRYGSLEGVGPAAEDPRHLTGYQIQANGLGWSTDRVAQLFVVDAPDPHAEPPIEPVGRAARDRSAPDADPSPWHVPNARQLTDATWDITDPTFTADGTAILVTTRTDPDADAHLRSAIHRIELDTDANPDDTPTLEPALADPRLSFSNPRPSADGSWLFALGADLGDDGRDFVATNAALYAVRTTASGTHDAEPVRLTDPETVELHGPLVTDGPDAVLVLRAHRGRTQVLRVTALGESTTLFDTDASAQGVAILPGGDLLVTASTPDSPGEVARVSTDPATEPGAGTPTWLTDFAAPLREQAAPITPRELTAIAPDGAEVHGWVVVPDGEGPHPVLLTIHGGPYAHYGPDFFDEFQVYAAAGYAVVACNPRGAASYGQAHGAAIRHDFGNLDLGDVLAFLDHATATVPGLDADRVGIQGGSYGGYLTAWTIAHDHRFAGAIVERGFLDPASFLGAADIGWFFMEGYNGTDRAEQDRQSPTLLAHQVRTPTFVVHSELDLRCPLGQALRYYTALKHAGVDAELLVFPGENHELSRSGTPWHRKQRFEAILDWWARHLPVQASEKDSPSAQAG